MRHIFRVTFGGTASAQVRGHIGGSGTACRPIGHNGPVATRGKRAGERRKARFRPTVLLLAVGVTLGVIAWGYLVKAAIDFGVEARSGTSGAWLFLGLASLGAVACLFIGLMLVVRLLRALGLTSRPPTTPEAESPPTPPRTPGGRRAAR